MFNNFYISPSKKRQNVKRIMKGKAFKYVKGFNYVISFI